jgi:serine/threonine protein phosphatase PrpC
VYFANAGDSRSFLVVYHKQTKKSSIVYITREDKPHLPEERSRVESMGGQVYEPMRRDITSRVLYVDPQTGHQSGLAMSRSLGDWEAGKMGVIPDPLVEVIDIPELVRAKMNETAPNVMIDQNGHVQVESASMDSTTKEDDVHIFAVSASDGMMDYVDAATVASILSESLFEDEGQHLLSACESLVSMAAAGWQKARQGRYRDDIAIAVTKIRKPPRTASPEQ